MISSVLAIRLSFWPLAFAFGLVIASTSRAEIADAPAAVDVGIAPGDDFDAYANGAWLAATRIPEGRARWGVRDEIAATATAQLEATLDEAFARPTTPDRQRVAAFRAAYLDIAAIDARGLAPMKPSLARIAALRDRASLVRYLGADARNDVDPLNWGVYSSGRVFGVAVERGIHGERLPHAYVLQGGLGLPDRDDYLDASETRQELRRVYRDYIGRVLALAGFDRARDRADAAMALETGLARCHLTAAQSTDEHHADHLWTHEGFFEHAPGIDWHAFFAAAGLGRQREIVAWQPEAIACEASLVATRPLAAWKDYLRFHALDRHAEVLPQGFVDARASLRRALDPSATPVSREQRARHAIEQALPQTVARLYVEHWFPAGHKARVQRLVERVRIAFARRIDAVRWMDPATKATALAKLRVIRFEVGYPDRWTDPPLVFDPHDAFANQDLVADRGYRDALARLDRPIVEGEWAIAAFRPVAVYLPLESGYNFAAALLQSPKFDASASDATNCGAIGAVIGHELSHYVDTLGADYDANGAMSPWWSPATKTAFVAAAEPLVAQYARYRALPDTAVDGGASSSENIADLGGLAAAFDAYREARGAPATDREDLLRSDREFFIAYARAMRAKSGEDALRRQAASDHAPERFRIATVRNLDAWYDAFDVKPGQALYLAPDERVTIW